MRVIHVLRKPLSEGTVAGNVLKHGCGGINIDASRVGTEQIPINRLEVWSGFGRKERPAYVATTAKGRWPSNVILTHLDGCRCDGIKRVSGQNPKYANESKGGTRGSDFAMGSRPSGVGIGHADKDGKESVANWICEPGCPVARLDGQTGDVPSNGLRPKPYQGSPGIYGGNIGKKQGPLYADKGGASRFFKQIGGEQDA
jgi:hypothetical protein